MPLKATAKGEEEGMKPEIKKPWTDVMSEFQQKETVEDQEVAPTQTEEESRSGLPVTEQKTQVENVEEGYQVYYS